VDLPRRTARVLLVDADGRVLLLRSGPGAEHTWSAPGGDPDELVRVVHDAVGLTVTPAELHLVATASGEDVFVGRRPRHDVNTAGATDWAREHGLGHRWWSVAELQFTTETVHPAGLAGLLDDVLGAGTRPPDPRAP